MSPVAPSDDADAFFQHATESLRSDNSHGNSALLLIEEGKVAHRYFSDSANPINADTVFSMASLSKWIAAAGVMKLVEENVLDLDTPVSNYLTRWQLPESGFDNSKVTVRRLLSHTAGFTDGLGFGDYFASETLPTLEESLRSPRTSSEDESLIGVGVEPGAEWIYSGGSYLLLELIVEEVTGLTFEEFMQREVFNPLGMTRTGYSIISDFENNAGSFTFDGDEAPIYQYASRAATALATTPNDLSQYVLAQLPNSEAAKILSTETIDAMLEPHGRTLGSDI